MIQSANLGFPRIGLDREIKKAVEGYWKGKVTNDALDETAREIRKRHWQMQQAAGIDHVPSNDFTLYDHVLDTSVMLGAIPSRYSFSGGLVNRDTYFAMARGNDRVPAMEMTKWFDTNYHYIVPEFETGQTFSLASTKIIDEFLEAKTLGILTRPVLVGPISFLLLGKSKDESVEPLGLVEQILPIYLDVLGQLAEQGAEWIQIDEPMLSLDMDDQAAAAFKAAYKQVIEQATRPKICLTSYFDTIEDKLSWLCGLGFEALHLDLVRAPQQLDAALEQVREGMSLSLGVVNGRNIWKTEFSAALDLIEKAVGRLGPERIIIASSCSMLHSPIDLEQETKLDAEVKERMAYAKQKLDEINVLRQAVHEGRDAVKATLDANAAVFAKSRQSSRIHNPAVQERMKNLDESMFSRKSPYPARRAAQERALGLPELATTTIGSFPQTPEIRKARAGFKKGAIPEADYTAQMKAEIETVIRFQEKTGLDVLVHGEPERNDMVEYFGQMLEGFAFTQNGWVQSYGSRCVKPPIIYGDVSRPKAMTVDWTLYAQSLTDRPVKGMLTGPITILQWSFVREDQPRKDTAWQIALSIRDEVADLEKAGIKIIQIDEPALREGTPLRAADRPAYFDWAVKAFRLATSCVEDQTQIHTHMCYCDFNDIMDSIAALDADVISIEASRSGGELLDAFVDFRYPNEIGPGVYDIHSPRVPSVKEMQELLRKMLARLSRQQLWVNPDCGLKTRGWPETEAALKNMVTAARALRN